MKQPILFLALLIFLIGCQKHETSTFLIYHTDLSLQIDTVEKRINLSGEGRIATSTGGNIEIPVSGHLKLSELTATTGETKLDCVQKNVNEGDSRLIKIYNTNPGDTIVLRYNGSLVNFPQDTAMVFSHQEMSPEIKMVFSDRGLFLNPDAHWYPHTENTSTFTVSVKMPAEWYAECAGELTENKILDNERSMTFCAKKPTESFFLSAARYFIFEDETTKNAPMVRVMLLSEDSDLASTYLRMSRHYISLYEKMIGPYLYDRFDVVENFLQTGYGMPGYTLLGSQVMRLPFIPYTSLGHEVLHNWWGNGVFVDYRTGNWCEGLTNYMADYTYTEAKGKENAFRFRYEICKELSQFSDNNTLFPLNQFKERTDRVSRVIGYGKAAMVFHYMVLLSGKEKFMSAMKEFYARYQYQKVGWKELFGVFDEVTGMNQSENLFRWIEGSDIPNLSLSDIKCRGNDRGQYLFSAVINQENVLPLWNIYVPIRMFLKDNSIKDTLIYLTKRNQPFRLRSDQEVEKIALDPEFNLLKYVPGKNRTVSFSDLFKNETFIYYNKNMKESLQKKIIESAFESRFISGHPESKNEIRVFSGRALPDSVANFLKENKPDIFDRISGFTADEWALFTVSISGKRSLFLVSPTDETWLQSLYKIKHYGKYSFLVFEKNQVKNKYIDIMDENKLILPVSCNGKN